MISKTTHTARKSEGSILINTLSLKTTLCDEVFKTVLHLTRVGHDKKLLIEIFKLGGIEASKSKIKGWRTSLGNPRATHMPDLVLKGFFDGMFKYRDMVE